MPDKAQPIHQSQLPGDPKQKHDLDQIADRFTYHPAYGAFPTLRPGFMRCTPVY